MQAIISFIVDHQAILAALVVAIGDLLIALNSNIEANGIFHAIYLFAKGKVSPPSSS